MPVTTLVPNDQTRPIILAAVAAGTPVLWNLTARLYYYWNGTTMASGINGYAVNSTSGYQIIASTCGMAATLPNPPGIPALDTVLPDFGGLGLPAMAADDFALSYWQSQGLQS
jgi:hypothetical protein